MKKSELNFNKTSVVELNDAQMRGTDSGITPVAIGIAIGWLAYEIYDHYDGDND